MIAVKYSGTMPLAHNDTAMTTTAAIFIMSGSAPAGAGWNQRYTPQMMPAMATAAGRTPSFLSIAANCAAQGVVSMRHCAIGLCIWCTHPRCRVCRCKANGIDHEQRGTNRSNP